MDEHGSYGPLEPLIGRWQGVKGIDIAPHLGGDQETQYREVLEIRPLGFPKNASQQTLAVVGYQLEAHRLASDEVFHTQLGFWHWDAESQTLYHSLVLPRAMGAVLEGEVRPWEGGWKATLSTQGATMPLMQSNFLDSHAKTLRVEMEVGWDGQQLHYEFFTYLEIYGASHLHRDSNVLERVQAS